MSATATVTNPPPAAALPPTPGPGDVALGWVPITTRPPKPVRTYPVNEPPRQKRLKMRMR